MPRAPHTLMTHVISLDAARILVVFNDLTANLLFGDNAGGRYSTKFNVTGVSTYRNRDDREADRRAMWGELLAHVPTSTATHHEESSFFTVKLQSSKGEIVVSGTVTAHGRV